MDIDERKTFLGKTAHDLSMILEEIHPYIDKFTSQNKRAYEWISSLLEDAGKFDKASDSFRYPFAIRVLRDNDGLSGSKEFITKPFFYKQTSIDLIAFINKMEIAFDILESYFKEKSYDNNVFEQYNTIFLEEGGDYYSKSVIGYSYNQISFSNYVSSYIETANHLYVHMVNSRSNFFIPMCYLYRTGIELVIKEILFEECSYSVQESLKRINKKKHSIKSLWKCIEQEIINHARVSKDDKTIKNVNKYIEILHNLDPQSDKFRYPINKNLDFHFVNTNKFDLENVSSYFEELFNFLSGASSMMSWNNELLAEMKKESMEYLEY